MREKASLKDIAKEVGVSTALVSYVLNNLKQGRINKEFTQEIRDAARRPNYRPKQIAKSLKTNKTNTIGLIVVIGPPFSFVENKQCVARQLYCSFQGGATPGRIRLCTIRNDLLQNGAGAPATKRGGLY